MFQELSPPVYGECTNLPLTEQRSFDSDDGYQPQNFQSYSYGTEPNLSYPVYSSSSNIFNSQQQMESPQDPLNAEYPDSHPLSHHDLPAIVNHPDLQWITTSNTDMRTQSPLTNSSNHRQLPPKYPTPTSPPNITLPHQGSLEDSSSSAATVTHHQLNHHGYLPTSIHEQTPPPLQRVNNKPNNSAPPKKKGTPGRKRKFQDHELPPAEAAKRHIRRERNKVAAAKCRNRRRELTDRLQGETDQLEDHQNLLHREIIALQQEKEHLEFILAAHSPNCKAGLLSRDSPTLPQNETSKMGENGAPLLPPSEVMEEVMNSIPPEESFYYLHPRDTNVQLPNMPFQQTVSANGNVPYNVTNGMTNGHTDSAHHMQSYSRVSNANVNQPQTPNMTLENLENLGEAPLNTPVCTIATPSQINGVFTFPSTINPNSECSFSYGVASGPGTEFNKPTYRPLPTPTITASVTSFPANAFNRYGPNPSSCSEAHRRSSSSESHHSPESATSHELLAL